MSVMVNRQCAHCDEHEHDHAADGGCLAAGCGCPGFAQSEWFDRPSGPHWKTTPAARCEECDGRGMIECPECGGSGRGGGMTDKARCSVMVYPKERWGAFHGHPCERPVKENGMCGLHAAGDRRRKAYREAFTAKIAAQAACQHQHVTAVRWTCDDCGAELWRLPEAAE